MSDSDSDRVTVTNRVIVTVVVIVAEFVIVTVGLHLYFKVVGRGKDRWL
jgi:hypothetical protein